MKTGRNEGNARVRADVRRGVKRRLAFYGGLVLALVLFVFYATAMPGTSHRGPAPELTPEEKVLQAALEGHLVALAEGIGERYVGRGDSLARAKDYLLSEVRGFPGVRAEQVRTENVGESGEHAENIVVELPGQSKDLVVIGAHYDSAHGTPGADDNATGVAVALELVKRFAGRRLQKTLRFVLFANEEHPYFQTAGMGSLVHAEGCRRRGEQVLAMLSLESIGYYSDASGSQRYPWPVGLLYPDRGNFLAFVGNLGSRSLVREAIGAFRESTAFPSEGAALPAGIPGIGWSDHWAFWESGYSAIMVTDTAPFRNPNYHESTDVPATVDFAKLARVARGLERVTEHLATRN